MSHRAAHRFWRLFAELPPEIQQLARENFLLLKANPHHPSLHLKRVGRYWSARVGSSFRTLGVDAPDGIVWFWIGPHEEYDRAETFRVSAEQKRELLESIAQAKRGEFVDADDLLRELDEAN